MLFCDTLRDGVLEGTAVVVVVAMAWGVVVVVLMVEVVMVVLVVATSVLYCSVKGTCGVWWRPEMVVSGKVWLVWRRW